jgi:hypothetical protein
MPPQRCLLFGGHFGGQFPGHLAALSLAALAARLGLAAQLAIAVQGGCFAYWHRPHRLGSNLLLHVGIQGHCHPHHSRFSAPVYKLIVPNPLVCRRVSHHCGCANRACYYVRDCLP